MQRLSMVVLLLISILNAGKLDSLKQQCNETLSYDTAKLRSSGACQKLGDIYYFRYKDYGISKSASKAFYYYKMGCDAKHYEDNWSCSNVAEMYLDGDGVPKDPSKAFIYAYNACLGLKINNDSNHGCYNLGEYYLTRKSYEDASEAYALDCLRGPKKKGCTKALKYGKYACREGSAESCNLIGSLYQNVKYELLDTISSDENDRQAENFYQMACQLGIQRSCSEAKNARRKGVCSKEKIKEDLSGRWQDESGKKHITFFLKNDRLCLGEIKIQDKDEKASHDGVKVKEGILKSLESFGSEDGVAYSYEMIGIYGSKMVIESYIDYYEIYDSSGPELLILYKQ